MTHSVRSHLKLAIDDYDASIRRFVPAYDDMIAAAADAVAATRPALALDLGSGTGALAQALLARSAVGAVELLDVDAEMLDQARVRLAEHGGRARFTLRSFHDALPRCDAVAASLSLHHIPTLEQKEALFRRIFEAVPRGGVFVNADVTLPAQEPARGAAWRSWADHLVASGIEEDRAWRHFEEWSGEDTYFPLEAELAALTAAGFTARAAWRHGVMSVVVAKK